MRRRDRIKDAPAVSAGAQVYDSAADSVGPAGATGLRPHVS